MNDESDTTVLLVEYKYVVRRFSYRVDRTYIMYERGRGDNCVKLRNLVQRYVCTSYVHSVPEGNLPHRYRR